ncbi:MAG: collagen-like protein [Clostridiales bacterium]|nr:collagen-like protein [Clostridiales bacterium]
MKEKKSRKFKILASVLGIVVGVSAIFAPACAVKSVDDTYVNENGELIIVYTDGTEKNLGVVKGEDGKDGANGLDGKDGIDGIDGTDGKDGKDGVNGTDGKDGIDGVDGKDLTACAHEYGSWQTEIEATCTSIGYDTRTCALCGDLDYRFNEAGEHNYDLKTAVSVMGDCTERWVNVSCKNCGDTALQKVSNFHFYDENGVCTECGFHVHYFDYEKDVEVVTDTCGERIINVTCQLCSETFTVEEEPVIEHVYENGVCTECGNLEPCDSHSNWFAYCEECNNCSHYFDYYIDSVSFADESDHWTIVECECCDEIWFINMGVIKHRYDLQNAVDVISTCEEHWVNATCLDCNHTHLLESYIKHPYDENGVCTECGDITHFIESDEYIEYHYENGSKVTWWSIDRSYGYVLSFYGWLIPLTPEYLIEELVGAPDNTRTPRGLNGIPITGWWYY